MARHLLVVGMPGAGKTTLGAILAGRLGLELCDSDRQVEKATGMTGAAYAAEHGVEALHAVEAEMAIDAMRRPPSLVITPAASVAEHPDVCRLASERCFVVWLAADPEVLVQRTERESHRRGMDRREIGALEARRRPAFARLADITLDAVASPDENAERVIEAWSGSAGNETA